MRVVWSFTYLNMCWSGNHACDDHGLSWLVTANKPRIRWLPIVLTVQM